MLHSIHLTLEACALFLVEGEFFDQVVVDVFFLSHNCHVCELGILEDHLERSECAIVLYFLESLSKHPFKIFAEVRIETEIFHRKFDAIVLG